MDSSSFLFLVTSSEGGSPEGMAPCPALPSKPLPHTCQRQDRFLPVEETRRTHAGDTAPLSPAQKPRFLLSEEASCPT